MYDLPLEPVLLVILVLCKSNLIPYLDLGSTSKEESAFANKLYVHLKVWAIMLRNVDWDRIMDKLRKFEIE